MYNYLRCYLSQNNKYDYNYTIFEAECNKIEELSRLAYVYCRYDCFGLF